MLERSLKIDRINGTAMACSSPSTGVFEMLVQATVLKFFRVVVGVSDFFHLEICLFVANIICHWAPTLFHPHTCRSPPATNLLPTY